MTPGGVDIGPCVVGSDGRVLMVEHIAYGGRRAAKVRLEERQREFDRARGRSEDDECKPRGPDGTPKAGRPYARHFGVPEDSAQENFTDPDSLIMKQSNGGFDQGYNGQTAVDAENGIVVAAELVQCASDAGELEPMLDAVGANLGGVPERTLADAGYRSEAAFEALADRDTDLIVSLGREGREARRIDVSEKPRTAAMAERLASDDGRAAYRRRRGIVEPPNGWIKNVLGFRQFSLRGGGIRRARCLMGPDLRGVKR